MSDAIVLTSQQPGDPKRAARSSAPSPEADPASALGPAESLVPQGFRFDGTVAFQGRARIDGTLAGPVEGHGRLEIGESASVRGDVRADEVIVAGLIEGDLVAAERLELRPGARVQGAVRTPSLQMHEGAILDGPCTVASGGVDPDS